MLLPRCCSDLVVHALHYETLTRCAESHPLLSVLSRRSPACLAHFCDSFVPAAKTASLAARGRPDLRPRPTDKPYLGYPCMMHNVKCVSLRRRKLYDTPLQRCFNASSTFLGPYVILLPLLSNCSPTVPHPAPVPVHPIQLKEWFLCLLHLRESHFPSVPPAPTHTHTYSCVCQRPYDLPGLVCHKRIVPSSEPDAYTSPSGE